MCKKNKNNSGFTLAELIVVLAIIGVLSAILIPTLSSYYKNSKLDTANANAKMIYNVANQYAQKCISMGAKLPSTTLTNFSISDPGSTTTAPVPDHLFEGSFATGAQCAVAVRVAINVGADRDLYGTKYTLAINEYGGIAGVVWYKNTSDPYIGGYPNIATDTNWTIDQAKTS